MTSSPEGRQEAAVALDVIEEMKWFDQRGGLAIGMHEALRRWIAALSALPAPVAAAPVEVKVLTLGDLQRAHVERQEEWCPEQKPDLSFRGNEMAGEVGEACNVIKKLERERHGWRGTRATKEQLAEELADVIHTATLCAITAGIDIEAATIAKFDATSEKNGLSSRIRSALIAPAKPAVDLVEALTEAQIKTVTTEYLSHRGERPYRVLRGGQELWEAHAPAMRWAFRIALQAPAQTEVEK